MTANRAIIDAQIRKALIDDAAGLQACMQAAYARYQERMGGHRLPPMDLDYQHEISHYPVWVVAANGKILGGLVMDFGHGKASIANIAINPEFQGQGIGGKLMQFAEAKAREQRFAEVHLTTHVLLEENVALYRHLGWQEISRDESRVYMKKAI